MANYSVDIAIAVKGARELKAVRAETTALTKEINTLNKLANKQSKTLPNSFNTLNKTLGKARGNLNKVALGTERYFRAIDDVIDKEERLNRAYKKQKTDFKVIERLRRKGLDINKQNIQQIRNELAAEIKLERAKRRTGKASISKGMAGKLGGTASSAIIGGAFPLLFGQTGAAAVGGATGGALGGLIGGQFGFALSIAGTAIGSAIDKNDKFNESLAALNVQFSNAGGGAQLMAKDIDSVAKSLRISKEEAFGVLGAFAHFGSGSIAKSLTEIFGSDAAALNSLATANRQAQLANQIFEARTKIGTEVATQLLHQNLITNSATIELALAEATAKAANDKLIAQEKTVKFWDRFRDFGEELLFRGGGDASRYGKGRADKLQKEFEEGRTQRMKDFIEAMKILREQLGLVNEAQGQFGQSGVLAISAINDKVKDLQDEIKMLTNPIYQVINLSESMASSFEQSFKGIITGSMTAQEALRNLFMRTADAFLDMAAQMIAKQIQMKILGIALNFLGGKSKFGGNDLDINKASDYLTDVPNPIKPMAEGGPVSGGRSYLVGEKGPELFTPGVSGGITPNHALGGTTNVITVNVDASSTAVEGDSTQANVFGNALAAAIQAELINQQRAGGLLSNA